jgi:hypothetical protein
MAGFFPLSGGNGPKLLVSDEQQTPFMGQKRIELQKMSAF